MREAAAELLRGLIDDMQEFCWHADHLEPCGAARWLLQEVRQRLQQAEHDLQYVDPEPCPVPLWPGRLEAENT